MLQVKNLSMYYQTGKRPVKAIQDVSLELGRGEILGLVGESGCGKSAMLLTFMRLIPYPGKIISGEINFQDENLLNKSARDMRRLRGNKIAMIFQDPMTTLNPVFKVGEQIREVLRVHNMVNKTAVFGFMDRARKLAEIELVFKLMREVGIPAEEDRYCEFPHEYSGGMQQRALIAAALSCEPDLLLADEPTTALDVTIQAQIIELLKKINRERGTAIVLVTHDLAMAAEFCHRIAVMYAGRIVETGLTDSVIGDPRHPYTAGLLQSIPRITAQKQKIKPIAGTVPDLAALSEGCSFYPRCDKRHEECLHEIGLTEIMPGHQVRCTLYNEQRQAVVV